MNNETIGNIDIAPYVEKKRRRVHERKISGGILKKSCWLGVQSLMEEVDRTVTHMKDEAANFPDPADRASQEEEFGIELRARDRERRLIKKSKTLLSGSVKMISATVKLAASKLACAVLKPAQQQPFASTAKHSLKSKNDKIRAINPNRMQ